MRELAEIQKKLKAPKGQYNKFGKFNYRSCEDILEAVKPLLGDNSLVIVDDMVEIGGRVYVKATAQFISPESKVIQASAYAREGESKKGMDPAQLTGSTSSYARKYALNGLFCIDDNKDSDSPALAGEDALKPMRDEINNTVKTAVAPIKGELVTALTEYGCKNPDALKDMDADNLFKIKKAFDEILG